MATLYARTGGGNWNTAATWSSDAALQENGAAYTTAPVNSDICIIKSTSGTVTVDGSGRVCKALDCAGTLSFASTNSLTIGNSTATNYLTFQGSATITGSAANIVLSGGNNAANNLTTNGKSWANLTITPSGTTSWVLQDSLTLSGSITQTSGTFDTNNQTVNATSFVSSNTNTRTTTFGSSAINLSLSGVAFNTTTTTGHTITANTAVVTISGNAGAIITPGNRNLNGMSFVFTGNGLAQANNNFTCLNFTRIGTAVKTDGMTQNSSFTATGTLTLTGNSAINRLFVSSNSIGTARGINAAVVSITNVDFQDIIAGGAAAPFTGTSLGDALGNTNITFTTAQTNYWVGGTGNWSDINRWASSSGGTAASGRVPLSQDNVVIDNNSGAAATAIAADMPRLGKNIDTSGRTSTWSNTSGSVHSIFGNFALSSSLTTSWTNAITFSGRGSQTISLAGENISANTTISAPGGTYTLLDTLSIAGNNTLSVLAGTLSTDNNLVSCGILAMTGNFTKAITAGISTFNLNHNGAATLVNMSATSNTSDFSAATFNITNTNTNTRTFVGGGLTYGTLNYLGGSSSNTFVITGSNTFAALNFMTTTAARTLQFTAGTTTTISTASGWQVNGVSGFLVSVQSATAATHTISVSSGTVSSDYLNLTNSIATGGASFYAGANSTNSGGNTGWTFTAAPSGSTSNFFHFF